MSGWREVAVREVADVFDGPHATPSKTDKGPWYLSISSLNGGRFDLSRSAHLSHADFPRWTKRVAPRPGDTLFSYETRLGEAAYWEHDTPAALGRRMGLLRPKLETVEPRYLMYAYLGPQFQEVIRQKTLSGATVDRIPVGDMPAWPIVLPSLGTQRTILDILGSVDDLIENNRRRVEVLEEMARAIYREWFVKFHYPGHGDVPMVESALGQIPEGWSVSNFGAVAVFVGGNTTTKASYVDEGYVAFSAAGPDGFLPTYQVDGDGVVLSAVGARCGRTFWASGKWSSIANTIKILPKSPQTMSIWLYFATEDPLIWPKRGSAQPFVSISDARGVRAVVADQRIHEQFETVVRPMFDHIRELRAEAECLVRMRDLLLPKLVTGQIDVSSLDLDSLIAEKVA